MAEAPDALHGWIVIDKPLGMGSTNVVSWVKRALREGGYAKVKVGHGGTLDPLATGVLPIALGEATKLAGRMLDASKVYDFTITFGTQTDSLDLEGQVIAQSDVRPTLAAVDAVLPKFTGAITQIPPAFSALKVDGKRAYDLARAGEDVVLAGRDVVINGSRGAMAAALVAFPDLTVLRISAPIPILAERLAARGRESKADILARLARASYDLDAGLPVIDIANDASPDLGVARLLAALYPKAAR